MDKYRMMNAKDTASRILTGLHRAVYKSTGGKVAGTGLGMPVVILTTIGRTSGQPRQTMLTIPYQWDDKITLVASNGGDTREPAWCRNLRANPEVEISLKGSTQKMRAYVATDVERDEIWPKITSAHGNYAGYQKKTDREIPVVILEPA
jgi:deazaflavin-dependent oxidoreductase (nitroreductase family)